MRYPRPVIDIMSGIVAKLPESVEVPRGLTLLERLQAANDSIRNIHFMHGHPLELIATLQEINKDPGDFSQENPGGKWDVWPRVMLFTDFPEVYDKVGSGYFQTVTLQMIIAMQTRQDMKSQERLETNFTPILIPIYQALMKQIMRSGEFVLQSQKQIPHTKIDRYFWGKTGLYGNTANMFNDFIDAIEIQNLSLRINY